MYLRKVQLWFLAALVFAAIFFTACSNNTDSSDRQNPEGRPTFFVTLDTQGAQEWAPITVYEGDNLEGRLQTPTKQGFIFEGWSSSGDAYVPYDLAAEVTSDLMLYAKWDGQTIVPEDTYRLTVHLQGGAFINVPMQDIPINHKGNKLLRQLPRLNLHPNPPPEFSVGPDRKAFAVWNTEPDGSGEYIFPDTLIEGNLEIYAMYAKPIATTEDVRNIVCNNSDVWYAFETTLAADVLTAPLCQNQNEPFKGKILPGFPVSTAAPNQGHVKMNLTTPVERAGLFIYTDGADLVGLAVNGIVQNADIAGMVVAQAKDTRIIASRVDASGGSTLTAGEYAGGAVGIGDNITIDNLTAALTVSGKYVGGIAGKLTNSSVSGAYYTTYTATVTADGGYGGGVVGYMENGTIESSHYTVQPLSLDLTNKVTSTFPNVSMGTLAGYLKNVDVRSIDTRASCPVVIAQREYSTVGMVGTLDGGSIKGVRTCGTAVVYGVNSVAGGIVGKMLNNASVEDVIATGAIRGIDAANAILAGSHTGGIVGDSVGGRVKGALAMNSLIIGEAANTIVAAIAGTDITKSYFIIGIRKSLDTNSLYTGGVSRYEIYDKKAFFNDSLGWDFENSAVWEMSEYDELPLLKGTGTDYIRITTAEELYNIGFSDATLRSNYVLMNDIDLSTFNGGVWMPIGSQSPFSASANDFRGTLHGNNKKILNFRMNNGDPIGLFYRPNGGSVRHLIIEDFHFTYVDGGTTAAAPLANNGGLNVRNVHATGVIDYAPGATAGFRTAAGLITSNTGNTTGSSISDSSFNGTIKVKEDASNADYAVAGIVTSSTSNLSSVSTSKSSGRIEIQNAGETSSVLISSAAGIAQRGTVQSSYSDMDIIVSSTGPASNYSKFQVGGITATATSVANTRYNYFAGSINLSSTDTYNYAGGIIGDAGEGVLKTNLVLTDNITVDDDTRNNYGRVIGKKYFSQFYPSRTTVADECYVIDTLPNGVDKETTNKTGTSASNALVANGTDLPSPVDSAFLESLDWDMSLWKPVAAGTLPKLAWEE